MTSYKTLEAYQEAIGKAYMSALHNHPYATYKAAKTAGKALEQQDKKLLNHLKCLNAEARLNCRNRRKSRVN